MELPHPEDDHFGRVLSAKKDAAATIVNLGIKVDENRLRKSGEDVLKNLYDKIQRDRSMLIVENVIH